MISKIARWIDGIFLFSATARSEHQKELDAERCAYEASLKARREREAEEQRLQDAALLFQVVESRDLDNFNARVSQLVSRGWQAKGDVETKSWTEEFDNGTYDGCGTRRRTLYRVPMTRMQTASSSVD